MPSRQPTSENRLTDGLCATPAITMRAHQLLGVVCRLGGADCPLLSAERAEEISARLASDPTASIRLTSPAEEVPHYSALESVGYATGDTDDVLNRKRDLDVLQRLGLLPGDTRRARYLYELLFTRVSTPDGICAYDTDGWAGCPLAKSGAYESVHARGWKAVVYCRSDEEMAAYRERNAREIENGERLIVRPHHLMCLSCWYGSTGGGEPRPNDTIYELYQRIKRDPEVPITLVEGCCQACDCCDGYHPENGRCVHGGGLIRDYKKDLDCFQKLGMMPGDTMPAKPLLDLLFERIHATTDVCGYGDGVAHSYEWGVCGGPEGNPGYVKAREEGVL